MIDIYLKWKSTLGEDLGVSESLLHLHAGLAIFALAALLLRRPLRSWWPLAIVLGAGLANELVDYLYAGDWSLAASAKDIANTVFWPAVITLLARRMR